MCAALSNLLIVLHMWDFLCSFVFQINIKKMPNQTYLVYSHTNRLNGHVYIGITYHKNPNIRWGSGRKYKHSVKFYYAILKYGWNTFEHIILYEGISKEEAIEMEKDLIKKYKNLGISYNIGNGGEGTESFSQETIDKLKSYVPWIKGRKHSQESLKKISEAGKGRSLSDNARKKIGDSHRGEKHWQYGKKISPQLLKALMDKNSISILQFTLKGEFMREFNSATEASIVLKIDDSHIGSCCRGKRKTSQGYIWKYKNELS